MLLQTQSLELCKTLTRILALHYERDSDGGHNNRQIPFHTQPPSTQSSTKLSRALHAFDLSIAVW